MKNLMVLFLMMAAFFISLNASVEDISEDMYYQGDVEIQTQVVQLPADFNYETANKELLQAEESGNIEKANLLSLQINTYWLENRVESYDSATHGTCESNSSSTDGSNGSIMYRNNEENSNNSPSIPYWFDDVRIDPREIWETSLVSLSNGELYCISKYVSSGIWSILIRRSIDGGVNWTTYWDHQYGSNYLFICPRIVECHDTLIISFIILNTSTSKYRTWAIAALPGNTYRAVSQGSPLGYIDAQIIDYRICTDGSLFTSARVHATWTERYGPLNNFDSTRVMYARSNELNLTTWELGPNILSGTATGSNNIYFTGTRIAHGSAYRLWIVACLHPNLYPGTYDEGIMGWYSANRGASWSSIVNITSYNNGINEYQPSIAGSHINDNWVCLTTSEDIAGTYKRIRNYYSTDNGTNWTNAAWITSEENFFPDIWVDDNSTAFFGVSRRDITTSEEVRYKRGDITDPNSWSGSIRINDDDSNLSNVYGPSVAYNYASGDAIIAWTNHNSNIYSIWFDDESWSTGVEEENPSNNGNSTEIMNIVGNPSHRNIDIRYTITIPGNVRITLFDVSGRTISELVNTFKEAGSYELNLEPNISSGVYYISINSPEGSGTKQVLFVQ